MTKATSGTKSKGRRPAKAAGSSEVEVKVSARPKRGSSKIREGSEMDPEDPKPKKTQNTKKISSKLRSQQTELIRARHAMLVTKDKIDECEETEEDEIAEYKARFTEEEKTFDDLLVAFQAEAALKSDERTILDSYSRQELEMTMAFESTMEYADEVKEAKAEILHKTQHPSSADAAAEIHRLEYDLHMLEQKAAIRAEELSNILNMNEALIGIDNLFYIKLEIRNKYKWFMFIILLEQASNLIV